MSRTSKASAAHIRKLVSLQKAFTRIAKTKSRMIGKLDEQIAKRERVVSNMKQHRESHLGAWQNAKARISALEAEILMAKGSGS